MVTPRRVGRWVLFGLGGLLALVVLARVGLGVYLGTPAGRAMVARKISDRIGMPVEVTAVRLGLATSSIGMRVFDPAAPDPAKAEVLAVEEADADVSLFGLAVGRLAPDWVRLRGVTLTLHVDADGKVLTTLPEGGGAGMGKVPAVTLEDGRLTVRQDGRPEFGFENLRLAADPGSGGLKLAGSIDDPRWSKWTVSGVIDWAVGDGWVELATPDGPLTMDRLESVPFVPPSVWEHVRADGRGAVAVRVWADPAQDVRYSVDIRPDAAALTLPDASATLANVTGLIRVSGARVQLQGTRAELADGTLAIDGDLDFGPEPSVLKLDIDAKGLDTRTLPGEWQLPKDFAGKLSGHADLVLRIHDDGRIEPDGSGQGVITGVQVLGFPGDDIPIRLENRGGRYEFRQPKAVGADRIPDLGERRGVSPTCAEKTTSGLRPDARQDPLEPLILALVALQPPADDDGATTLDATIRLRDIEVAELLDRLKVDLGYKVSGRVTVEATVAVPLARAGAAAAYQFTGTITSPALRFEGLTVRDVSATAIYQDGKLTLSDLSGKVDQPGKDGGAPGAFKGTATAAVAPPGAVTAALTFDRIPLGETLKALPGFTNEIRGTVSGRVDLKAPYEKLSETSSWTGSGTLKSAELVVEGRSAKGVRVAVEVAQGVLTLTDAAATVEGIPVAAEGTLTLSKKYPFAAVVRTTGTDVADLRKLVPEVEIPAPVEGVLETETKVTGTASPLTYAAAGRVKATKLTLAKTTANHVELAWELTPDRLAVSDLRAEAFGGTVTGSADVPLGQAEKAGAFEVAFKNLDAGAATELVPDFPVRIGGKVSGQVKGAIPPAQPGQPRVGNLDVNLTAPQLTVQGIPAERLVGRAAITGGVVEYQLEGKTLGGSFEINGRYPGRKKGAKDKAPPNGQGKDRGSFRLTGLDLARVGPGIGFRSLDPLRGRVDASFDFENDLSAGSGRVVVTNLQWGDRLVARELTGVLLLRDGVLELAEVSGRVAGGDLRARARVPLTDTSRNFVNVSLNGADARRLFAPVAGADGPVEGPVTVVVRGRVGRETRASGTLTLPRGSVSGVAVNDLRVPFEYAGSPGGYARLTVREASAVAGSGRVRAEVTADFGTETRIDGQVRFTNLPLRALAPGLAESSFLGNGRITGRFDVGGTRVRSVNDLNGRLIATLNNTSVRELPILRRVTPFLNRSGLVRPFDAGDVQASLTRGVFRVQRLALSNPSAQLFAEGTVALDGRVDLDVVAHVGSVGPDSRCLRLLGLALPVAGPVPLTIIRDVTDFISNRSVRLSVTGTVDNPVVRVNLGALLTEEAVRFFLTRYVLPTGTAGALGVGSMRDRR